MWSPSSGGPGKTAGAEAIGCRCTIPTSTESSPTPTRGTITTTAPPDSTSLLLHAAFLLVVLYVMLDSKDKVDRSTAHLEYYREEESNFYINMKDNTRIHGPLSQVNGKDDDEVDADPAFGKIVAGFDAVERLHAVSTKTGGSGWEEGRFVNTVIIRYAKILPQAEEE